MMFPRASKIIAAKEIGGGREVLALVLVGGRKSAFEGFELSCSQGELLPMSLRVALEISAPIRIE